MRFREALETVLDELGVAASGEQIELMRGHFELLRKWSRKMSLTTVTNPRAAARRHFGEAAFVHRELPETGSVVDVGSGGGFPGLPFAVLRPEALVTLVESRLRKAAFLRAAARRCPNVAVAHCRIECWEGRAEWALLRAVNPSSVLHSLTGRAGRIAFLGTTCPEVRGWAGQWRSRAVPWSDRGKLWLRATPSRSEECST